MSLPGRLRTRTRGDQRGPATQTTCRQALLKSKYLSVIGAFLAAALLAGCGGSKERVYSIAPTEQCLHARGERAVRNPTDQSVLTLQWAFLRFHPDVKSAKDFDVSTLSANFGGYVFHRVRRGNVSLIWATGGQRGVEGPSASEVKTVESCLRA